MQRRALAAGKILDKLYGFSHLDCAIQDLMQKEAMIKVRICNHLMADQGRSWRVKPS